VGDLRRRHHAHVASYRIDNYRGDFVWELLEQRMHYFDVVQNLDVLDDKYKRRDERDLLAFCRQPI
jgi:hypothetical protein